MSIYKGSRKVMCIVASQGEADLTEYQKKNDLTLNTTDKTVSGAINELKEAIDNGTGTEVTSPNIMTYSSLEQLSLTSGMSTINIFNALPNNSLLRLEVTDNTIVIDIPENVKGVLIIDKNSSTGVNIEYKVVSGELYIGQLTIGEATTLSWKRVCTTTVKDGSGTIMLSLPSNYTGINNGAYVKYKIVNGWCVTNFTVGVKAITTSASNYVQCATGLPPSAGIYYSNLFSENGNTGTQVTIMFRTDGTMRILAKGNNVTAQDFYLGNFAYPVKES